MSNAACRDALAQMHEPILVTFPYRLLLVVIIHNSENLSTVVCSRLKRRHVE